MFKKGVKSHKLQLILINSDLFLIDINVQTSIKNKQKLAVYLKVLFKLKNFRNSK